SFRTSFRLAVRLALEGIIQVRVTASEVQNNAGRQIQRQEQRPPTFVLPYMHMFVAAAVFQAVEIASQDDMPESHGGSGAQQRNASAQKSGHQPAVDLDRS